MQGKNSAMEWAMSKDEPLSETSSAFPRFFVGKNSSGCWIARDQHGLRGGFFVSRAEAIRFAMGENGHRPYDVIMVADTIELDMTPSDKTPEGQTWSRTAGVEAL
jgi:hypothetical protein